MRLHGFFAGAVYAFLKLSCSTILADEPTFVCAGRESSIGDGAAAKSLARQAVQRTVDGRANILVVFAKFKDEAPDHDQIPDFANELFDPNVPGSVAHFYHTMSFGQLRIHGAALPKRYSSAQPASAYLASAPDEYGSYGQFVREILQQVDEDIDLGEFDNDGEDGISNSGDDDGWVDYVCISMLSTPRNFLLGGATGIAGLQMPGGYRSQNVSASGIRISVGGFFTDGAIFREGSFSQTVGSMAHEFGHALGLPDLYDTKYASPADDSAGIGCWGLMGWGAHGWNGDDGPNAFSAWSLEQLGWVGLNNERLVELLGDEMDVVVSDLYEDGLVYKIPLHTEYIFHQKADLVDVLDYLLLEQRVRGSHYYNRHLPAEGLLVWHVRASSSENQLEEDKKVDLVCADGLYADAGYPLGKQLDPRHGRDNLDFWSHDTDYARRHGGNRGDATDPFDGIRFTQLNQHTNPATASWSEIQEANTGIALANMRRMGNDMIVDVVQPRWAGIIRGEVHWAADIHMDGDLTIAPEGRLVLGINTRVLVAGEDRLRSGVDPSRCELRVEGDLRVETDTRRRYTYNAATGYWDRISQSPVVFESLVSGGAWYGILVDTDAETRIQTLKERLEIRDSVYGVVSLADHLDRQRRLTAVEPDPTTRPAAIQLLPNYPNPFNSATTMRYELPAASPVRLTVFNALGQLVRTLVDGTQSVGTHSAVWDGRNENGRDVAGGIYIYQLRAGRQVETRSLSLLR